MRNKLLTILLLLTGFIYLTSVFELDSKEMQQNYQKENHCYLTEHKTETNSISYFNLVADLPFTVQFMPYFVYWANSKYFIDKHEPDPPGYLYLRNCVLLI